MRKAAIMAAAVLSLSAFAAVAQPPKVPSAARGEQAYRECVACHNAQPGALAPVLNGIVGRPAGAVAGFRYSGPLKRSGVVWTPQNLRAFLVNPQGLVPGNRMPFSGVADDVAADIVAYLQALPAK